MDGTLVGQEFATQSVNSPGLEEQLAKLNPAQTQGIFMGVVSDLKYAETARRGFMHMRFTPTAAKATWYFISTVKTRAYTVDASATLSYSD